MAVLSDIEDCEPLPPGQVLDSERLPREGGEQSQAGAGGGGDDGGGAGGDGGSEDGAATEAGESEAGDAGSEAQAAPAKRAPQLDDPHALRDFLREMDQYRCAQEPPTACFLVFW